MNSLDISRRHWLLALGAIAFAPRGAAAHELPADSLYRLDAKLTDQDGRATAFSSFEGKPVLVSMFYTSCQMVCPMLFETVHQTLNALPVADRKDVRVLMVSFDPARDTAAVLKETAAKRDCDSRWTLARTDDSTTRKIAALLGIQYRRLADGEFNHSTVITLLDREGRIAAKTGKLGTADPALVKRVHSLVAA